MPCHIPRPRALHRYEKQIAYFSYMSSKLKKHSLFPFFLEMYNRLFFLLRNVCLATAPVRALNSLLPPDLL